MSTEKKNLFDKAIDALTTRDEKEAAEKAKAHAVAAQQEATALRARLIAEKAAAAKAAAVKAARERAALAKEAAEKAAAERAAAAAPKKGIVTTRSLRVRKDHNTTSEVVAGLVDGNEVTIVSTWTDGKNIWAKLENGWAAMQYNGETYIKFS